MTGPNSTESKTDAKSKDTLQEYFGLIYDAIGSRDEQSRDVRLLRAWGVFRYLISGPSKCEHCQAEVRLAVPVVSERFSGERLEFDCLCTTCTFKELQKARMIVMQVGDARVEYPHEDAL